MKHMQANLYFEFVIHFLPLFERFDNLTGTITGRVRECACVWVRLCARVCAQVRASARVCVRLCACVCAQVRAFARE